MKDRVIVDLLEKRASDLANICADATSVVRFFRSIEECKCRVPSPGGHGGEGVEFGGAGAGVMDPFASLSDADRTRRILLSMLLAGHTLSDPYLQVPFPRLVPSSPPVAVA